MPKQEKMTRRLRADVYGGIREAQSDGTIIGEGDKDEPFEVVVQWVTKTVVTDGRGRRWGESGTDYEEVGRLSITDAKYLLTDLADALSFCAEVAEKRVLTAQPSAEDA